MTRVTRAVLALLLSIASVTATYAQSSTDPHQHHAAPEPTPDETAHDHAGHEAAQVPLPDFIPPVTEADRAAAFPDVHGHAVHDRVLNYLVLADQLEWQTGGEEGGGFNWDVRGWVGHDRTRLWFRTEGDRAGGRTEQAQTNLLYGRAIARWWDLVAGVRVDTLPATPRAALAFGVQGLAPYRFDLEATAFVEPSGRTHVRLETEYDLLVTNRLVLQPLLEFEVYGTADRDRLIAAGLSTGELGLRLRYEFRRELAPYVGVVWTQRFFGSGDLARTQGQPSGATRLAVGLRTWF